MGKYLSPTLEQVEEAKIKCAIIYYPSDDGLFFQQAVRGALAELRFWYKWEGDEQLTDAISQRFIETDLLTDTVFFIKDCEILEEIIEDGEVAINVNVNQDCGCGCSGGAGGGSGFENFFYPQPNNGVEVPSVPIDEPVDDGQAVPDGFDNYDEYREYKCRVATQIVDDFIETVQNMQTLGGLASVFSGFALLVQLGIPITYSGVVTGIVAVGLSVTGSFALLAAILFGIALLGSIVWSYFNEIGDNLVANRTAFICEVLNASNITEVRQVFYAHMDAAVVNLAIDDGVRDYLREAVVGLVDALVPAEIIIMIFQQVQNVGREDFDCSTCPDMVAPQQLTYTFPVDGEGWFLGIGRATWIDEGDGSGAIRHTPRAGTSPDPTLQQLTWGQLSQDLGLGAGDKARLESITLTVEEGSTPGFWGEGKDIIITVGFDDLTSFNTVPITADGTYTFPIADTDLNTDSNNGNKPVTIYARSNGTNSSTNVVVDDVVLNFR